MFGGPSAQTPPAAPISPPPFNSLPRIGLRQTTYNVEGTLRVDWAFKRSQALEHVATYKPDLVVVDEYIGYLNNLEFIRQLVQVDAFVPAAAVSRLPRETFHDIAEGLGIFGPVDAPPRCLGCGTAPGAAGIDAGFTGTLIGGLSASPVQ